MTRMPPDRKYESRGCRWVPQRVGGRSGTSSPRPRPENIFSLLLIRSLFSFLAISPSFEFETQLSLNLNFSPQDSHRCGARGVSGVVHMSDKPAVVRRKTSIWTNGKTPWFGLMDDLPHDLGCRISVSVEFGSLVFSTV